MLIALALALLLVTPAPAAAADRPLSDVVTAPRPAGGEYFGVYLQGQKIGYIFNTLTLSENRDRVTARTEVHIKAKVGTKTTERRMVDEKVYESRPQGKLLSFVLAQTGDGGEQTLEGTATPSGLRVLRKRPGKPNETLSVKASREVVEDADQARVALRRGKPVVGMITDTTDLEQYKLTTTLGPTRTKIIAGVPVKLRGVETVSDKEKVPTTAWLDDKGRVVELQMGPSMLAIAEPPDVARRIDVVEVFALTRVTLPRMLPPEARQVPGALTLVLEGLPERFQVNTSRQKFVRRKDGKVEVTITAAPPRRSTVRPLVDPDGGANLRTSIVIESDAPEIRALARTIVGDVKDAWTAAKKISAWVGHNVENDYGSSSDRATDVLHTRKGDCTEHALLAVSLMRAAGIPAKRVDGVVYVVNEDNVPALYWHEWVEAYVGEWTQLDPTFGQDVADATHFAVGEEASAEITPLIGTLKVTEVR